MLLCAQKTVGRTVLFFVSKENYVEKSGLLIAAGADMNAQAKVRIEVL